MPSVVNCVLQMKQDLNMRWADSIKETTAFCLQDLSKPVTDRMLWRTLIHRITVEATLRYIEHNPPFRFGSAMGDCVMYNVLVSFQVGTHIPGM